MAQIGGRPRSITRVAAEGPLLALLILFGALVAESADSVMTLSLPPWPHMGVSVGSLAPPDEWSMGRLETDRKPRAPANAFTGLAAAQIHDRRMCEFAGQNLVPTR